MNATMRFIVWGTIPIGSVAGGILATVVPVRAALILAAVASFASVVPVLASPLRSLRDIPVAFATVGGGRLPAPFAAAGGAATCGSEAGVAPAGMLPNETALPEVETPGLRPEPTRA
jgi:hypothetical protein